MIIRLATPAIAATLLLSLALSASAQVDAVTQARHDLKLGFTEGGKVAKVPVKPGDKVVKGQLLIELEDQEGQSLVELYRIRSQSDVEIRASEAKLKLAQIEELRMNELAAKNAAAPYEVEKAKVNAQVAALDLEFAKQTHTETKQQLVQAEARHQKYYLHAPTDGVIETVLVAEGETVEQLKPVLRMVVVDPLWIDAAVPTDQTLKLKTGDPSWIRSGLPGFEKPIKGSVIYIAEVADPASDTRLVRVEIPNSGMPAGGHVRVYFAEPTEPAAARDTKE